VSLAQYGWNTKVGRDVLGPRQRLVGQAWGYHDLLRDYWTSASSGHPNGACFKNGHSSDKLAAALGVIMKNQDQFRRPLDAGAIAWFSSTLLPPTTGRKLSGG
jgi:hypothetical protein